ncbi:MAG: nucleotidyltransferase domain-containing protein [Bacteroidia bacterium]
MTDNNIIRKKIKNAVRAVEPDAQVILYGSRARGNPHEHSDWDVLILLNRQNVNMKDEQFFRHLLYTVELETGEIISTYVYSTNEWNGKMSVTPLYENVKKDGVYL